MSILKETRKDINDAIKDDSEVTLSGNGVNCFEASAVIRHIFEEIKRRTK